MTDDEEINALFGDRTTVETGGPAFGQVVELRCVRVDPNGHEEYEPEAMLHGGLTVRDYFAAKVLTNENTVGSPDQVAKWAYEVADAMLKARNA